MPPGLTGRRNVAVFDDRRNTSRVFRPPPHALAEARDAIARWAASNPAHAAWIAAGAPTMTEAEHASRFGESYRATSRSRSISAP